MGFAVFPRRIVCDDGWKINLYKYGNLYKTIKVKKGATSVALGSCDVDAGDTFVGWSASSSSTTVSYSATSVITPSSDINLYAVFEYDDIQTISSATTYDITSEKDKIVTVTITFTAAQTITLKARYSANNTWSW